MGAVPKKKHTRSRSNKRRFAWANKLKIPNLVNCPSCKKLKESHKACPHCGFYK